MVSGASILIVGWTQLNLCALYCLPASANGSDASAHTQALITRSQCTIQSVGAQFEFGQPSLSGRTGVLIFLCFLLISSNHFDSGQFCHLNWKLNLIISNYKLADSISERLCPNRACPTARDYSACSLEIEPSQLFV